MPFTMAEETTVDGRGTAHYDLPAATDNRAPLLLRTCLALRRRLPVPGRRAPLQPADGESTASAARR